MKVGAVHPGTPFFPAGFQERSVSLSEIRTRYQKHLSSHVRTSSDSCGVPWGSLFRGGFQADSNGV